MKKLEGLLLIIPAAILIFMVMVIPMGYTVYCSLFSLDYLSFGGFIGIDNYTVLLTNPKLYSSLGITLIITFMAMGVSLAAGTLMALGADKAKSIAAYLIQLVGLIPWVTSMVVAALLWKWIFNGDTGLMNYALSLLKLPAIYPLLKKGTAVLTVIFVMSWRTIGYSMIMILAGLKGLPHELIEAAQVDGANSAQVFFRIKLPMLATPALISSIVLTMSNFNNVTIPMILTSGGPGESTNVITLMLYRTGFGYFQFGLASALSFFVLLLNIVLVIIYVKAVRYRI